MRLQRKEVDVLVETAENWKPLKKPKKTNFNRKNNKKSNEGEKMTKTEKEDDVISMSSGFTGDISICP